MFDDETVSALKKIWIYDTGKFILSFEDNQFKCRKGIVPDPSYIKPLMIEVEGVKLSCEIDNRDNYLIDELNKNLGPLGDFIKRYDDWRNSMNKILKDAKYIEYSFNNYPVINKIMISPIDNLQKNNTVKGKRFTVTFKYEY